MALPMLREAPVFVIRTHGVSLAWRFWHDLPVMIAAFLAGGAGIVCTFCLTTPL